MSWQTQLTAVITPPDETKILLQSAALPRITAADVFAADFGKMAMLLSTLIGNPTLVLRLLDYTIDRDNQQISIAIHAVLLPTNDTEIGPDYELYAPSKAATLVNAAQRQSLDNYFSLQRAPSMEAPWSSYQWYLHAHHWIESNLTSLGYTSLTPTQQFKIWGVGCVLQIETDQGRVWFKACRTLPLFVNEASVTAQLAREYPLDVAQPLAIDEERNWLLTPHVGNSLNTPPTETANGDAYRQLARLQKQTIARTAELKAMGCLVRDLEWLRHQITPLLDRIEQHHLDDRALIAKAREKLPQWDARIEAMKTLPFPDTLIHGDFHVGNVFGSNAPFRIIDWSDASISHPLIDLQAILYFADEQDWAEYLTPWFAEWGIEEWLPIVKLSRPIIGLFHLLSFEQILSNVAPSEGQLYVNDIQWYLEKITLDDFAE